MTLQDILPIQPDEKGVIVINIDGSDRKFIKTKLIDYLQKDTGEENLTQVFKPAVVKKRGRPKKTDVRPVKLKRGKGSGKRRPVIATLPDGMEREFESGAEAARNLGIDRTNIPHVLSGKYCHCYGIKFRYANG